MKRILLIVGLCFSTASLVGCTSSSDTQKVTKLHSQVKIFRNNAFGYSLGLNSQQSAYAIGFDSNPADAQDIGIGRIFIEDLPVAGTSPEAHKNFNVHAREFWEWQTNDPCNAKFGTKVSPLQESTLPNVARTSSFSFTIEKGCLATTPGGRGGHVVDSPMTYILTSANDMRYLISFEPQFRDVYEQLIATMEFFPPCGGEKQPHCPSALPPSGIYKLSSTGALIPIEWNQQ